MKNWTTRDRWGDINTGAMLGMALGVALTLTVAHYAPSLVDDGQRLHTPLTEASSAPDWLSPLTLEESLAVADVAALIDLLPVGKPAPKAQAQAPKAQEPAPKAQAQKPCAPALVEAGLCPK